MTTERHYWVPEHRQQGGCSVTHLSPLPAGYGASPGMMGRRLGGRRQGRWDQLGDSASRQKQGVECNSVAIAFALIIGSNGDPPHSSASYLFIFHLYHLHVWAHTVTDAEPPSSSDALLAGLQFNHCSAESKGQTVGGQWAVGGSILIISLNETGHH